MGKRITSQKRGRGSPTYRAPSFRYVGAARHKGLTEREKKGCVRGQVRDLLHCPGHYAPLMVITYEDGETVITVAPLGIRVGDHVESGFDARPMTGSTLPLINIPEGTPICNVENQPGDGGRFVRSSGLAARIEAKSADKVIVNMPSKMKKEFRPLCRAMIGIVAGGGRPEKPLVKAGNNYHKKRARNKLYPRVCGLSMNALDHPFGGSRSSKKGKVTIAPRNAPPGRRVGLIRPRRSGRRRGR